MISNYFTPKIDFDSIIDNDPIKNSRGDYWYLNSHNYEQYSWSTEVFSDEEIDNIRVLGIRLNTERAETGGKGKDCLDHRRSFVSWFPTNDLTSWVYQRLTSAVNKNNEKHFKFNLTMIERLQFTFYDGNEEGCYKSHIDPLNWNNPHNRKLSFVLQLSHPSEYEGGELKLYNGGDPITIKREKGLIVFFPSYTLHEVTPVTKGERYTLVGWVHGPAFK